MPVSSPVSRALTPTPKSLNMQFPESWLREYCNPQLTTQELADTLTMAGLEVEELEPVAPAFTGIVVGEIKEPCSTLMLTACACARWMWAAPSC